MFWTDDEIFEDRIFQNEIVFTMFMRIELFGTQMPNKMKWSKIIDHDDIEYESFWNI